MRAELVAIGTELLLGQISNTNARWMSERLAEIGVDVLYHAVTGDNAERIVATLALALERADVVLVTGGLGPTQDDITREAISQALGAPLEFHPEIEDMLRERYRRLGWGEMPPSNLRQAYVPHGARWITPTLGSAPGLAIEVEGARLYAMAGVPAEMVEVMEGTVLPELAAAAGPAVLRSEVVRCVGIGESRVGEIVADLFESSTNPSLAYLASAGEVKLRITAKAETEPDAHALIAPMLEQVRLRLGDAVFTVNDESLEGAVGRLLRDAGRTLACAESLTGGSLAARITRVPGASDYFVGSAVVYTETAKRDLLGVTRSTLDGPGVVSRECALEMARGARRVYGADLGLALTGAAGPEPHGGADPGTVWVALAEDGFEHSRSYVSPGGRVQVRRGAEQVALDLVRRRLDGSPLPDSEPTSR